MGRTKIWTLDNQKGDKKMKNSKDILLPIVMAVTLGVGAIVFFYYNPNIIKETWNFMSAPHRTETQITAEYNQAHTPNTEVLTTLQMKPPLCLAISPWNATENPNVVIRYVRIDGKLALQWRSEQYTTGMQHNYGFCFIPETPTPPVTVDK
ncbi:MAG: hypothetical protein WCP18_01645 [bacterium]